MLYQLYDLAHFSVAPWRLAAEATQAWLHNPFVPASYTNTGRAVAASAEMFERSTRRFTKPAFRLYNTEVAGRTIAVTEEYLLDKPFCRLLHFARATKRNDPKVLIVAPLSGHHATLLRGTVEALLPEHDVYITDWVDAKEVPLSSGTFNLDDNIAYIMEFIRFLGPDASVIAVCQPAVPVFAAAALMAAQNDPNQAKAIVLMGGPIDTSAAHTKVTELAETRPLSWFEQNVITDVPFYYKGAFRRVYPGFLQLTGFMTMNLDRHIGAHIRLFDHLARGADEAADKTRDFYNEYLAVMDLPAEFYLQTIETVFQKRSLATGTMRWRGEPVDPSAITKPALMTVEGELDDISGVGQTSVAHALASNLAADKKLAHIQQGVGHYGIFNGRRWREEVMPLVRNFIRTHAVKA